MKSSRQFWCYTSAAVLMVFSVIALAIWQSAHKTANHPVAITDPIANLDNASPSPASTESSAVTTIPEQADPRYPAPAKKLHKVLSDPQRSPLDDAQLTKRMQKLDQQLATLNEQLRRQGLSLSERSDSKANTDQPSNDIESRLAAIKAHMASKAAKTTNN
ncbi:MAG: hypothetical protein ACI82Z_001486 [Cellvibrionaceae bacterium]|jgi:hypothetical protein